MHVAGIFRIPCRFNSRKYPFADQQCELHLLIDSAQGTPKFEKFPLSPANGSITFHGRKDVGEFRVKDIFSKEEGSNKSVALVIKFSPYYGYHLLNSFLTSLLILLISFATFFFRIGYFNERIMVSLTSLLVLTGLFTQANSTSVNTPYLKLVDIWYASLIFCTFLNVVANTGLNAYLHKLKSRNSDNPEDLEKIWKRVLFLNKIIFGLLSASFSIFLLIFVLASLDII